MEGLEGCVMTGFKWLVGIVIAVVIGRFGYDNHTLNELNSSQQVMIEQQAVTIKNLKVIIVVEKDHTAAVLKELKDCNN